MSRFTDKGTRAASDFQIMYASLPGSSGNYRAVIHYGLSLPGAGWEMGFETSASVPGSSQWPMGLDVLCYEGPLSNPSYANDAAAGVGGVLPYQSYQLSGTDPALPYPGIQMIKQETSPNFIGGIVAQNTILGLTVSSTPVGTFIVSYTTLNDGISHKYRISSFINNTFNNLTTNFSMDINFTDIYGNSNTVAMVGVDNGSAGGIQTAFTGATAGTPVFIPLSDVPIQVMPNTNINIIYQVSGGSPVSDVFASIYMFPKDS